MIDYAAWYGLEKNPFLKNSGDILVDTTDIREAHVRLNGLKDSNGFGLITGEPGRGKTTAVRTWANSLNQSLFKVTYSSISSLTVLDFYRKIAAGLGSTPSFHKNDLFDDIQREIRRFALEKKVTPVIIIDEADMLSHKVLRDLQLMFNFEMDSRDLAIVLLVGQNQLINTLNQNAHESLRQRILMNYHMLGITKEEGRQYIARKLESVGCLQPVFNENAVESILNSANGAPRVINKICDKSLLIGAMQGIKLIDPETVLKAVNEITLG